jgi:uncharacterized damage-inducible protein DinB
MQLKATAQTILSQIFDLVTQLSDSEFTAELELLNGNTLGKHVRHIIEFFDLLISGSSKGIINYDKRKHEVLFETSTEATLRKMEQLIQEVENLRCDNEVFLEVSYSNTNSDSVKIKSSLERELAYNIEHAIHHMAIIKIAIQTVFPNITVDTNFGVAYSTVRFQNTGKS